MANSTIAQNADQAQYEHKIMAAAQADRRPGFNGARRVGVYPGTPFLYGLPVSGQRPIQFSARQLPPGLSLDTKTGIITGSLAEPGEYRFEVRARNGHGRAKTEMTVVCGDTLALTPPMGWNSYDAFGDSVREPEVLSNALWLKEHLQPFGWDTVVVDFRWYDSLADGIRVQNPEGVKTDDFGRCIPATNRFPSGFKALADQLHAMGLHFGIHIMRGIPRRAVEQNLPIFGSSFTARDAVMARGNPNRECQWNRDMFGVDASTAAGKAWYASLARQYADWGVDFIKCDDIANMFRGMIYGASEIAALSDALRASGRSIILSLSPGPAPVKQSEHLRKFANLWRISNDFWDNWNSLNRNFDLFAQWQGLGGPGHWPDGDMIPFGHICARNCDVKPNRWTRFTRPEQLSLLSLWALAPSPLMLGMNLPDNDDWTTAILTNPEVLAVNQDPAGRTARKESGAIPGAEVWRKELADGSTAIGFFNRASKTNSLQITWSALGFGERPHVRDLWLRKNLRRRRDLTTSLPPHGCLLFQVVATASGAGPKRF